MMADAIFDASGNVAGNGGGGLQAWSGAGALASILPSATSGISTTLPALFLSDGDGDSELSKATRATPRYTYPEAKRVDYGALAAQAAAAKNQNTNWDGGDIADLQNKLDAYNKTTGVYNYLNRDRMGPELRMTDQQRGQYYDAILAGRDPTSVLSPLQQRMLKF